MYLASIPSPPIEFSAISIGPFTLRIYAVIIVVAILLCLLITNYRLVRRGARKWVVFDLAFLSIVFGIIGARIWHVLTHFSDYFAPDVPIWKIIAIWEGGNAIIGSLLGGAFGLWLSARRFGFRFLAVCDAIVPGILAAQVIGRLGNWFNHELYGKPTSSPWGLEIPPSNPYRPAGLGPDVLFHPVFLYEMLWNLTGIGIILLLELLVRLRYRPGTLLCLYLVWYGLGRLLIEGLRIDQSGTIFGMRANAFMALIMFIVGLAALSFFKFRFRTEFLFAKSAAMGRPPAILKSTSNPQTNADATKREEKNEST